jgi:hypothetical protein
MFCNNVNKTANCAGFANSNTMKFIPFKVSSQKLDYGLLGFDAM